MFYVYFRGPENYLGKHWKIIKFSAEVILHAYFLQRNIWNGIVLENVKNIAKVIFPRFGTFFKLVWKLWESD